jgi:hypothetical protein
MRSEGASASAIKNEGRGRLFSSVYRQYLTVHKASEFGGKEHHGIRDVLRGTQALHGDPFHQRSLPFLSVASPLPFRGRVGTDEARRHAVYGDTEWPQLVRQLPGQARQLRVLLSNMPGCLSGKGRDKPPS